MDQRSQDHVQIRFMPSVRHAGLSSEVTSGEWALGVEQVMCSEGQNSPHSSNRLDPLPQSVRQKPIKIDFHVLWN